MKKMLVLTVSCLMVMAGEAAKANDVLNGHFESGTDGWYISAGGTAWSTADPTPIEETHYLKMWGSSSSGFSTLMQTLDTGILKPKTTYTLTAWVYFSQDFNGVLEYGIQDGTWAGMHHYRSLSNSPANQWFMVQSTFSIGATAPSMFNPTFFLEGNLSSGFVAFDHITLIPTSVVANGGFEGGDGNWYLNAGGYELATSNPVPQEGGVCLKIWGPSSVGFGTVQYLTNMGLIRANTRYTLTAWVYFSSDFSGTIEYGIQDGTWAGMHHYLNLSNSPANQWFKVQCTFATGDTIPAVFAPIFFLEGDLSSGFVALDNVSMFHDQIDDDFIGLPNSLPNSTMWDLSHNLGGTLGLNGTGQIVFNSSTGEAVMQTCNGFNDQPASDQIATAEFFGQNGGTVNLLGLSNHSVDRWILIRNDRLGTGRWMININGNGDEQNFDTGITFTPGSVQSWQIEWSPIQVKIYKNTILIFDSVINAPIGGGTWNIPSQPLGPYICAVGLTSPYLTLDRLTWNVGPKHADFPVGWYDQIPYNSNSPYQMATEDANIALMYNYGGDYNQTHAKLDQAVLYGMKLILELPRGAGTTVVTSDTSVITSFVQQFANHPALYGWYIGDEPQSSQHQVCKTAYDTIKQLDSKPIFIAFCSINDLPLDFADAYDVLLYDKYPCIQGESEFSNFEDETDSFLWWTWVTDEGYKTRINDISNKAAQVGKPWWTIVQAIGRVPAAGWTYRLPTYSEYRFMVYYGIYKKAKGCLSWCLDFCQPTIADSSDPYPYSGPQWINDVEKLIAHELNILGPALAAGCLSNSLLTDNMDQIDAQLWRDPSTGDYYITAMNLTTGSRTPTFSLNLPGYTQVQPLFENRSAITLSNCQFTDSFNAYQVHVYKLLPSLGQTLYSDAYFVINGDANGDGMVDVGDLGILAANYGKINGATRTMGDFNGDGAVDVGDLGILAANYGVNSHATLDFNVDFAKAFGTTIRDDATDDVVASNLMCGTLSIPLIAGLMLIDLTFAKL